MGRLQIMGHADVAYPPLLLEFAQQAELGAVSCRLCTWIRSMVSVCSALKPLRSAPGPFATAGGHLAGEEDLSRICAARPAHRRRARNCRSSARYRSRCAAIEQHAQHPSSWHLVHHPGLCHVREAPRPMTAASRRWNESAVDSASAARTSDGNSGPSASISSCQGWHVE